MKVSVIGTGYVGLIQATGLAKLGHSVTAIDVVPEKIEQLKKGIPTIYEEGLQELLNEVSSGITFTLDKAAAVGSDIIFLCVPTPQDENGKTDLGYLKIACESLSKILIGTEIIVVKSTVPVGTNSLVFSLLGSKNPVVSNPEFLREGVAIYDFFNPARIILGFHDGEEMDTKEMLRQVYASFLEAGVPYIESTWETAELIKYASNSFLAMKITFMNEMARLSDACGADIVGLTKSLGLDPRIGDKHLYPGLGYGGSCFPKDVKSLIHQFQTYGIHGRIIECVDAVNATQAEYFVKKILTHYNGNLHGKTIAVSGIAFKPGTDDLRESKGIEVIKLLLDNGASIRVHDYNKKARENFQKYVYSLAVEHHNSISIVISDDFPALINDVDALVITLEDTKIQSENLGAMQLRDKVIFDGRNILDKRLITGLGYTYYGIGY